MDSVDTKIETEEESCNESKEQNAMVENGNGKISKEDVEIFGKTLNDKKYRHQIVHSISVCFCMFTRGLMISMVGPTFPDLQLIIDKDLSVASWLFTALYLGGIFGAICGGFAYDRYNKMCVFIFIMVGLGVFAGITPLCAHFAAMITTLFLHGAFGCALDTVATADISAIWRQKSGPFLQAFHCAASVGFVTASLVAKPFLAEKIIWDRQNISEFINSSIISPEMNTYHSKSSGGLMNEFVTTKDGLLNAESDTKYGRSYVFIPYLIGGLLCILALALFLLVFYKYGNVDTPAYCSYTISENSSSKKEYILTKKMKLTFTLLFTVILTEYLMIEQSLMGYLMTFIITELEWSKAEGATIISALWITFSIGRISGIFVVRCLKVSIVLIIFYIILNTGTILFWISVSYGINTLVWISVLLIGFGMSIIFASGFSWISENVRILTGKMISILIVFVTVGAMINPVILGNLMEKYTQLWMIYWLAMLCASSFLLFLFVYFLFRALKNRVVSNNQGSLNVQQTQMEQL